ncbi:MAG TPA: hypothetical protein VFI57_09620 [Pyrinomonadaceae bacterium]|jgi:exonuclease VII small subunit|nr:hypothetical protein [Pyrinomonadaceae bacterium]
MSEDLTQKLPTNGNDNEILTAIKDLEKKVDGLEKKVDERLHDTRPIWHKVVAGIAELQTGQKRLEDGQKRLEDGQKHLEEGQKRLEEGQGTIRHVICELSSMVHSVNRDQIVINDSIRRIQLDFLTVNEKLLKIVVDHNQQNSST